MSKKSFRHAVRIFKLSKKFKNTCRLNAKGAFCPLHTSPAALSQTSSARFFDSLRRNLQLLRMEVDQFIYGVHKAAPAFPWMNASYRCRSTACTTTVILDDAGSDGSNMLLPL